MPIIETNSGYGLIFRRANTKKKKPKIIKIFLLIIVVCICTAIGLILPKYIGSVIGINSKNIFSKKTVYFVAMDAGSDYNQANLLSNSILEKGGAGNIIKNQSKYQVVLGCYKDNSSAEKVVSNLASQNTNCIIVPYSLENFKLDVKLDIEQNKILKNTINLFWKSYENIYDLSICYDNKTFSKLEVIEEVKRMKNDFEKTKTDFENKVCKSENSAFVYLKIYLDDLIQNIENLINAEQNFGGYIKKTYVSSLTIFNEYLSQF